MNWMLVALNEAKKAYKKNEVPVGCVIVKDEKIVSKAYNKKEKNSDVMGHAEIISIKKAAKKMKSWKLDKTTMYVTLKPCDICYNVIRSSRIEKVIYLVDKLEFKKDYNKTKLVRLVNDIESKKYKKMLNNFFKEKRNKGA